MPTARQSAQIGTKECGQTVTFLVELYRGEGRLQHTVEEVVDCFHSSNDVVHLS